MEHRYWRGKLAARLRENGYTVQEECPIGGGKTVDILASKEGRRIAFEIETGKSDALANVQKSASAAIDRVVVVATSEMVRDILDSQLRDYRHVEVVNPKEAMRRIAGSVPISTGSK
jgi:hypothetical protein